MLKEKDLYKAKKLRRSLFMNNFPLPDVFQFRVDVHSLTESYLASYPLSV